MSGRDVRSNAQVAAEVIEENRQLRAEVERLRGALYAIRGALEPDDPATAIVNMALAGAGAGKAGKGRSSG